LSESLETLVQIDVAPHLQSLRNDRNPVDRTEAGAFTIEASTNITTGQLESPFDATELAKDEVAIHLETFSVDRSRTASPKVQKVPF